MSEGSHEKEGMGNERMSLSLVVTVIFYVVTPADSVHM
jgi:hypothetical protein